MKRTATVAIATLMGVAGIAANANAATGYQVYSGTGWRIEAQNYHIHSLSPDGYTVQFASTIARTRLTPYVTAAAAQVQSVTGIPITVTTTVAPTTRDCSTTPRDTITFGWEFQPVGEPGMSHSYPCYNTNDNAAWGGWSEIDNEEWNVPDWFSTDPALNAAWQKNSVTHEFGHMIGLDHPNALDGSGATIPFDCPLTPKGYRPVMCAPNGGYTATADAGKFTSIETAGLAQLAENYDLEVPQ